MVGSAALLILLLQSSISLQDDPPLPELPKEYFASLMWNMKMEEESGKGVAAFTVSIAETVNELARQSFVETWRENNFVMNDETYYYLERETIVWSPVLHGVSSFLDIFEITSGANAGTFCQADIRRNDSFLDFLFGFDTSSGQGFPSVSHMLHWGDKNYTYKGVEVVNGINVYEYTGTWDVPFWNGKLSVNYFWSNPLMWQSTAGINKTAPVAIKLEGTMNINGQNIKTYIDIEFQDFFEVSLPESFFRPAADLWCTGRQMDVTLAELPRQIQVESELVISAKNEDGKWMDLLVPRTEWIDMDYYVSRVDYKPPDFSGPNPNPWANSNNFVSDIHDFSTGIVYVIDQTLGNCSAKLHQEEHHGAELMYMLSPFYMFYNRETFAINGEYFERGFQVDSLIRSAPMRTTEHENFTTVVMLTASYWEVDNQAVTERFIPVKIINYPNARYNEKGYKWINNYFNLKTSRIDMKEFDISPCFSDDNKMHLLVRLGWSSNMDIENTGAEFIRQARDTIRIAGHVTAIRVQNIEFDVDSASSTLFVVFTVVGYPDNVPHLPNELPEATRPLDEIKVDIEDFISKGFFKIEVVSNDGGRIDAVAEKGSLTELNDRAGNYSYKDGYSSGAMAACGIILLLISIAGFGALLVFVLKF